MSSSSADESWLTYELTPIDASVGPEATSPVDVELSIISKIQAFLASRNTLPGMPPNDDHYL